MSAGSGTTDTVVMEDLVNTEVTTISATKIWMLNGTATTDPGDIESITLHLHRKNGGVKLISDDRTFTEYDSKDDASYKPFKITRTLKTGTEDQYEWPTLNIENLPKYYVDEDESDSAKKVKQYTYYFIEDGTNLTGWSATYDNADGAPSTQGNAKETAEGEIRITNSKFTVSLPATGGMGTGIVYGAGAALMLLAVLGLILLNRKRTDGEGIR